MIETQLFMSYKDLMYEILLCSYYFIILVVSKCNILIFKSKYLIYTIYFNVKIYVKIKYNIFWYIIIY